MSEQIHVIYREEPRGTEPASVPQWTAYSYPVSIYAAGTSLAHVRDQFAQAAAFHLEVLDLSGVELHEHLEHPSGVIDGVFIRAAIDRRSLDRQDTATLMRGSLIVERQRREFIEHAFPTATGDVIIVACTPADLLTWVFDQMGPYDALQVCAAGPGQMVWWNALVHHKAAGVDAVSDAPTMGELGLSGAAATISDLIRSDSNHDRPLRVTVGAV